MWRRVGRGDGLRRWHSVRQAQHQEMSTAAGPAYGTIRLHGVGPQTGAQGQLAALTSAAGWVIAGG
jgi:hypothetical protein